VISLKADSKLAAIPEQTTLHIRPSLLNEVVAQVAEEWKSKL
jgi:hypothetical protein